MASSKVVIIHGKKVLSSGEDIDHKKIVRMLQRGCRLLTGENNTADCLRFFFRPEDRIGIKINTLAGPKCSTPPEVPHLLAGWIAAGGFKPGNLIIWDRTNDELRRAGYRLNEKRGQTRIFGTDTPGVGYEKSLTVHRSIGSLFSTIQTRFISSSISLALLKDHGLAGITAGMKNYFGAIHNPNKYHDFNCNPFVADLFDAPPIRNKHKLTILDGLNVQYHRGPSFHSRWNKKQEILIFSTDPVSADTVGWRLIERLRAGDGLPSLEEENREPAYLFTAEKSGLGRADPKHIEVLEDEI